MVSDKIWSTYVRHIATALRTMEKFTKELNNEPPKDSDLEFMVPTRIDIHIFGAPSGYALVMEDGEWFLDMGNEIVEVPF